MPTRPVAVVVDAVDPAALARFWAAALGWRVAFQGADEVVVEPGAGDPGLPLFFVPVAEPKATKNRVHLDLWSGGRQAEEVARLQALGARPADVGQGAVPWVVLADPEGNELCALDAREEYRDTGAVAAVVLDAADPASLARFWKEAAGWPVVREGDAVVGLRDPSGRGPFLELVRQPGRKTVKNRLHLDLAPFVGDDQAMEADRLRSLGAVPADVGQGAVPWVVLADPEGNELCVLTPR